MNARPARLRLGIPGYCCCLALSLFLAMVAQGWRVMLACGLALALAVMFYPAGLKPLARRRSWLLLAFLLLPAVLLGPKDEPPGSAAFSRQGLLAGVQMALRAIAVLVAVNGFAASVSVSGLADLLERAGFRGLGFSLGVAFHMLPIVQEAVSNSWQALRMRGGFRRHRLRAMRLLLVTIIVSSLQHADDIVSAAESRAFAPSAVRTRPVRRQWGDLAMLGFSLLSAAVFVLV